MKTINDIATLEALYDVASPASLTKVVTRLSPHYVKWINAARFCILSTVGPEGSDGSPRGDVGPVVRIVDIVRDGRMSLMFMVTGSSSVIRVNGAAVLSDDPDVTGAFVQSGKQPKSVIVVTVGEAYFQCAKAIMRSELWTGTAVDDLPTAGQLLKEQQAEFDAQAYDDGYAEDAKAKMW
jgi:predicted pyridoxine 5'-phosphate oxidase superfamily flavin-nucleotide-binding protein